MVLPLEVLAGLCSSPHSNSHAVRQIPTCSDRRSASISIDSCSWRRAQVAASAQLTAPTRLLSLYRNWIYHVQISASAECPDLAPMCAAVFRASTLACHQKPQLGTWPDGAASAELSSRAWPRSPATMGKRKKPWIPPPLSGIDMEALGPGTDVIIRGGAHSRIQGLRGFILPSTEENSTSFNVKLCQGPAPLQEKIWCVDRSHVERCDPAPMGDDDGLHPSLRWRLRPPPLTVYLCSLRPWMAEPGLFGSTNTREAG